MGQRLAVITEARGCVGAAVARVIVERCWRVRGLVRRAGNEAPTGPGGYEQHVGDLTRPATLSGLCQGADTVVHTAALVKDWGPEERFREINVEGTRVLLEEAQSGVRTRSCHLVGTMA